jgi:hypothetical protein
VSRVLPACVVPPVRNPTVVNYWCFLSAFSKELQRLSARIWQQCSWYVHTGGFIMAEVITGPSQSIEFS